MYDSVDFVVLDYAAHFIKIGVISFHKCIVGAILDILKVGEVAGVCEFIEIEDMVVGIFIHKQSYYMAADESGSSGD